MPPTDIPLSLRRIVRDRAQERCEYCQSSEQISGLPCEIDHIVPRVSAGPTTTDNLCLACAACNAYKGSSTHAIDPEAGKRTALFNPRQQNWSEHFAWSEDGVTILGLTAYGRATIAALKMNNPYIVSARALWVSAGWHPPRA